MFFPAHMGTSVPTGACIMTYTAVCSRRPVLLLATSKISVQVEIEQEGQNFI